jgi:hypothetical protein
MYGDWIMTRKKTDKPGGSPALLAALRAVETAGSDRLAAVPHEPSAAMLRAGRLAGNVSEDQALAVWRAMLDAAG